MVSDTKKTVAVIGGGIIGVTSAAYLLRDGYDVTIFDGQGIGESTSSGNAGTFAYFDFYPLPTPSILFKAPKWFFDPLGPLAIPLGYGVKILPWLKGFLWACRPQQVRKSINLMKQLMPLSRQEAHQFWQDWGLEEYIVSRSALSVYQQEKAFKQARVQWQETENQGFVINYLDAEKIQRLEPSLDRRFKYAVQVIDSPQVSDPKVYTQAIGAKLVQQGGKVILNNINKIKIIGDKIEVIDQSGITYQFHKLVVAAGAWSNQLTQQIGDPLPLDAERGYNTTLPEPGIELNHFVLFPEHGFVASPLACGLRIGGANELAGTEYPANYKRADHLLAKSCEFLPGLNAAGGRQWMGRRPSLPDTQPLIDYASASKDVVYAFGHGHYGLTQSAATARLVTQLINQQQLSIDDDGLKLKRFK